MKKLTFLSSVLILALTGSAFALDVTISSVQGEAFAVGSTVTFLATSTSGINSVTTYTWDFDDSTPQVVTTVPMVDHVFTLDDIYAVTVTVNNGIDPTESDFDFFEAFVPPLPTDPMGSDTGDKPVTNPDDGVTFTVLQSQAGFLSGSLALDSAHTGPGDDFLTDFGDGVTGRHGSLLMHQYSNPGIFILESDHTQGGSTVGKQRKTLAFAENEVFGSFVDPNVVQPDLPLRKLVFKTVKGKFNFVANNTTVLGQKTKDTVSVNDTLSLTWTTTLPAGFDVTTQMITVAVGNCVDTIQLDSKGVGTITTVNSPFKTVRFKLPRVPRGSTRPTKATASTVTVTMSSQNLPLQGFDTEGITTRAFDAASKTTPKEIKAAKGPFARTIQVATVFAGVSYSGLATINLTYTNNADFGTIAGRKATP